MLLAPKSTTLSLPRNPFSLPLSPSLTISLPLSPSLSLSLLHLST